ncbi:MAG: serine hydrolase [Bacteroidota bacterium]
MKNILKLPAFFLFTVLLMGFYPIDGFRTTRIARLSYLQKFNASGKEITRIPPGALNNMETVQLNLNGLQNNNTESFLVDDPELLAKIKKVIPKGNYSITVLDVTDPDNPKYAAINENKGYQPGSVGKIVVLNAFFYELQKIYPESWNKRTDLLRDKRVTSRYWGEGDHHTIPVYDIENDKLTRRKVVATDEFSLYEWLDHMVSVSNNGAASVVYRETVLMSVFGKEYPNLTAEQAEEFFNSIKKDSLLNLSHSIINDPLRKLGISKDEWRLGGPFTRTASNKLGRKEGSQATPKGMIKFLIALEQGNIVDNDSSLEMKRLLYLTDRRIRYAKSPKLDDAMVYFKSGSYYSGGGGKYMGSNFNYMNSVIIVEQPNNTKYMVCLMTNVLNKNSANDHYYLAGKIDDIINVNP